MSKPFKWISIVFGLVVVSLGLAYYYDHVTRKDEPLVFVVDQPQTNYMDNLQPYEPISSGVMEARSLRGEAADRYRGGKPTNMSPVTVTNTFDMRGTNEIRMIGMMVGTLATLDIEKDEDTVRRLVLTIVKADYSTTPQHFRDVPDWVPNQAFALKRKISRLLETTNSLTIQRVLECPIGSEIPPMVDYEVRKDVWEEIEAGKK